MARHFSHAKYVEVKNTFSCFHFHFLFLVFYSACFFGTLTRLSPAFNGRRYALIMLYDVPLYKANGVNLLSFPPHSLHLSLCCCFIFVVSNFRLIYERENGNVNVSHNDFINCWLHVCVVPLMIVMIMMMTAQLARWCSRWIGSNFKQGVSLLWIQMKGFLTTDNDSRYC